MVEEGNQTQPELFEKLEKAPRRLRRRKLRLPKGLAITISYENFIFGAILLVMSTVVCFTLGIERGKRIGLEMTRAELQPAAGDNPEEASVQLTAGSISEEAGSAGQEVALIAEEGHSSAPVKPEISSSQAKSQTYAIQLITYARQGYAKAELAKLKKNGFTPYIVRTGEYFVVYVGPYESYAEAQSILKEFKSQAPYRSALLKGSPR